jgi:prepilin-type N-terminal cleavage/methylation domain-containing protein
MDAFLLIDLTRERAMKTAKKNAGFALTEVVVAIVLLTIGIMAASSTLVAVFNSREYSKALTTATNLAQEKMENIKALSYSDVVSGTEELGTISGYEQFRRQTTVTPNNDNTIKNVTVEVVGSHHQSIKLETLISKK